ncbi:MAG: acetolactate synthase [Deltaproteobacteria bacterium]|nr:acetolactate synthase [Deltaproteobacteria bacterium]
MLHGGRIVAEALRKEGTRALFTLCGGHIQSIYDGCIDEGIRVVDVRHEQTAGHAADGWARVTGQAGVAAVTAGPGVTDALTAVANARRAGIPMILIGGQGPRILQDMGSLQDMNHVELMRSITKWSVSVPETRRLAEYVASAFRVATAGVPGPVFLEMPLDVLMGIESAANVVQPAAYRTESRPAGDPAAIEKAAELVAKAERPVLIVGGQLRWSRRREALAELLSRVPMPTFLGGMARAALGPDHPCVFGRVRSWALGHADLVAIFGTPFDFRLGYGRPPMWQASTQIIQVDLDGAEIGRNRGADVGIVGDTGLVLDQLARACSPRRAGAWLEEVRAQEDARRAKMSAEMESDASPPNPLRLCAELDRFIEDDTIVIGDGGDFVATAAYVLRMRPPGIWMDPGPLGTLGVGPGYAMAARIARPEARVVIVYGDGSFGLHGLEWEALVRQKLPVVGVIGNDAAWTQIRRGQIEMYGEERAVASALDHTRYDRVVEAVGGHGEYVESADQIRPALERAFSAGKPALVNVKLGRSDFRKGAISV